MQLVDLFSKGQTFGEFVADAGSKGEVFERNYRNTSLPSDLVQRFTEVAKEAGSLKVFALLEAWCPDAAENVPPLAALAESIEQIELRCFVRSEHSQLNEIFRSKDVTHIPAVLFCDNDFIPLGTWEERPEIAHELVDRIKKLREEGAASSHLAKKLRNGYQSGHFRCCALEEMLEAII